MNLNKLYYFTQIKITLWSYIVTLEIKKLIIKTFDTGRFYAYVNPASEYKYRLFTISNYYPVIDYINDDLNYYWKKISYPTRLDYLSTFIPVSNKFEN